VKEKHLRNICIKRVMSLLIDLLVNFVVSVIVIELFADFIREARFIYVVGVIHFINTTIVLLVTKRATIGQFVVKIDVVSQQHLSMRNILFRNFIFCLFFFGTVLSQIVLILFMLALGRMFLYEDHLTMWDNLTKTSIRNRSTAQSAPQ
jgi:hypothetical protein